MTIKLNRLSICFISLLFFVLAACNDDDDNALSLRDYHGTEVNDTISSMHTTKSSEDYPHTQPIKTQDAKYNFQITKNNNETRQQPQQLTNQGKSENQTNTVNQLNDFEQAVVELTNDQREKRGLDRLQVDVPLSKVARTKSKDMNAKNYFSHTSPTYGSPFDMMRDFGVYYQSAGENIAHGQRSPEEVVQAWMNSPGHRANILNSKFTHIGVGYESNGRYWTQEFIEK